ncbi:hypothetical protein GCM10027449_33210 [Sinomonas notoginsengisoli]|uniref:hypothetical protein n=1 Tax=Sinomonas notoginsengisoli TaxID=1457311 RepID=UPI001F3A3571|nr:hypothetical protein [Sinomonas notoginsengisoli]
MDARERDLRRAAMTVLAAAALWEVGITPVPRVYIESDPGKRLQLLERHRVSWVVGEHLAAAGTAAVPAAFVRVALALPRGRGRTLAGAAAAALAAGAPLFVHDLAVRASDLERFAGRRLPAWTFLTYAWLHVAALGSFAGALWALPGHRKEAAVVGLVAGGTGASLAMTKDAIPAVFYIGEQIAAASLLRRKAS